MPKWVRKIGEKTFFCLACGAIVAHVGQAWSCSDHKCENHQHIHIEATTITSTASAVSPSAAGTATTTT